MGKNPAGKIRLHMAHHSKRKRFLAGETMIDAAFEQAARFTHIGHAGCMVALRLEQPQGVLDEGVGIDFLSRHKQSQRVA